MANKNLKSIKFPGLTDTYVVPQVDDTLTQTGRPADAKKTGDEIEALKEDLSTLNSEGTVPTSEQMLSDNYTEDSVPYHFRRTASDNADREELEIVGGSVAWNQHVRAASIPNTNTINDVTFTNNGDGSITVSGTATAAAVFWVNQRNVDLNGHKVVLTGCPSGGSASGSYRLVVAEGTSAKYNDIGAGVVGTGYSQTNICIIISSGYTANNLVFKPQVFDLTAMFGSTIADHIYSLEQATAGAGVALFKSLFPKDYYPYDAGSMQSVSGLSEHKTVGFNQCDCVFESGGIDTNTGANETNANRQRTKNYTQIIPSQEYYCKSSYPVYLFFYDESKTYIGYYGSNLKNSRFIPANLANAKSGGGSFANARYVRARYDNATYTAGDFCINISDTAKNGTYEPYDGHSYALDDSLTLRGIPTLVDGNIKFDGDIYSPSGKVTRRYGIVDLGTLTWTYQASSDSYPSCFCAELTGKENQSNNYGVCSAYVVSESNGVNLTNARSYLTNDKMLVLSNGSSRPYVYVRNDAYTDAATFKSAMSGVYLVYKLATSTTESADPYVSPQICHYDGTEEFVSTGIVPVGHNTKYPDNMRAKLDGLPWNFASLIAPVESGFKATRNYTTGALLIVNNVLYKATANIANNATITPNTNVTATTLAEVIAAL